MRAVTLLLVLTVTGCGYAKRSDVNAEFDQLRQEMRAADEQTSSRVAANTQRLDALEQQLQQMRTEFGAQIEQLRGEFEGMIAFNVPVHFDYDDSAVRQQDQAVLDRFATVVDEFYPGALITVEGFTDPAGSAAYNTRLGQARADAVRDYLMSRGLTADQLRTVSYGEATNRLVMPGAAANDAGAELNRRVAFVVDARGAGSAMAVGWNR
jgi:outer membrane protein OmpA-like peptidoglycan-associated protein